MTYNPLIPQASDRPSSSQFDILTNFGQINTIFNLNHYNFNYATVADRGKHRYCSFPNQAAGPVTGATEGAIYCKDFSGRPALYFRRENSGTEVLIGFFHSPTNAATGSSSLPGGLMIQWGSGLYPHGESSGIVFDNAFSAPPYSVVVTARRSSSADPTPMFVSSDNPPTTTRFRIVNTDASAHTGYWIAIGPV